MKTKQESYMKRMARRLGVGKIELQPIRKWWRFIPDSNRELAEVRHAEINLRRRQEKVLLLAESPAGAFFHSDMDEAVCSLEAAYTRLMVAEKRLKEKDARVTKELRKSKRPIRERFPGQARCPAGRRLMR